MQNKPERTNFQRTFSEFQLFVLRRTSEQRAGYTATTELINTGRLHGVWVEGDAVGDQGGGGSVKMDMPNEKLLCKMIFFF
jgi:hypothetical protein